MPHSDTAYAIIAERIGGLPGVAEKKMFGGVFFMVDGNMVAGATKRGAMARVGRPNEAAALALPGVEAATPSGRRMAGFVRIAEPALAEAPETLERLVDLAFGFAASLPPKA